MSEYIDTGFNPNLKSFVNRKNREIIDRLGFTQNATPVSSLRRERVGVWFGTLLSNNNSFGIISVSIEPSIKFTAQSGNWYYGISSSEVVETAPNPYEVMVDSATQPVVVPDIALDALSDIFATYEFAAENQRLVLSNQN